MKYQNLETLKISYQAHESYHAVLTGKLPEEAIAFISKYVDLNNTDETVLLDTGSAVNFAHIKSNSNILGPEVGAIVNIKRVNDAKYINKLFEATNLKLNYGGIYIGCAETTVTRQQRILAKYFFPLNYLYFSLDFLFKRVFPKLPVLKKLYFFITNGRNRVLSEMEIYGRLYSCGFTIVATKKVKNLLYFTVEKVKEPCYNYDASYGPLIKLKRVGKNGELITVYKLRTMFAYSEYLQEMIYNLNNLEEGGKFKNDPRISALGAFIRRFWLDELPMIYNMVKGDLKIVGVRPLSNHYFNLYPKSLQELRVLTKPGLIPPFYADMPKTLEEIVVSEEKYIKEYLERPFRTDLKYFYKAMRNILIKGVRSK